LKPIGLFSGLGLKMRQRTLRKGAETKASIVREAAELFNTQGYAGTSLSDVLEATGLEKGGLYNHFRGGKVELAEAALNYSLAVVRERRRAALATPGPAHLRLLAMIDGMLAERDATRLKGGCPIQNVAVEADDGDPALAPLLRRARKAMHDWQDSIADVVESGVARGELRTDSDPQGVANFLTASLEGALMISKLYRDRAHMALVAGSLRTSVLGLRRNA
jgi:AcrR family transcriptional regulator